MLLRTKLLLIKYYLSVKYLGQIIRQKDFSSETLFIISMKVVVEGLFLKGSYHYSMSTFLSTFN